MLITACNRVSEKSSVQIIKHDSIPRKNKIDYPLKTQLSQLAIKQLKDEKNLTGLIETVQELSHATTGQMLIDAPELRAWVQKVKDSSLVDIFHRPDVKTYLNILWNECLRLEDMKDIPAITEEQIINKSYDIFSLYENFIDKINSVYQIKQWEKQMELDPDFEKVLIESGIIDTTSQKKKNPDKNHLSPPGRKIRVIHKTPLNKK
jgi:hypothetical protein